MKKVKYPPFVVSLFVFVVITAGLLILQVWAPQDGKKNEWGKEDYSQAGYVGNPSDIGSNPLSEFDAKRTIPTCFQEYVVWGGDTRLVKDCYEPPSTSYYKQLCKSAHEEARSACEKLCANTKGAKNECLNWQLQPRYYTEWKCTGRPPPPVRPDELIAVPHQECRDYYGCICTEELE